MREKVTDALLSAAIKTIEELEALVVMIGTEAKGDTPLAAKLRAIAALMDRLPFFENDLLVIKKRLRGMLSSDPDKTPRSISVTDIQAIEAEGKRFEPVEERARREYSRSPTTRGIGVPMPKKGEK